MSDSVVMPDSPAFNRAVLDALPDGVTVWRPEPGPDGTAFRLVLVNHVGRARFRGDPALLDGGTPEQVYGSAPDSALLASMRACAASGGSVSVTVEVPDGLWPASVVEATHVLMPDGHLLTSYRDVSERVRGERLLAAAYEETAVVRATLQTALDCLHDAFALAEVRTPADEDGGPELEVVHANLAAAQGVGLDAEAATGLELDDLLPYARTTGLRQVVLATLDDWRPREHRSCLEDGDGLVLRAWDTTVSRVGQDRVVLTWHDATREEIALRALSSSRDEALRAATHDALTGLPNRTLARQRVAEALSTCADGERVAVVFVDLDGFKGVNDTYGHAAGDDVLRATAHRLARTVRSGDTAARLSGDEFLLVLRGLPPAFDEASFVRRVRSAVAEPVWVEGAVVEPAASLGVVCVGPGLGPSDVDTVIARSDARMYAVKPARAPRREEAGSGARG